MVVCFTSLQQDEAEIILPRKKKNLLLLTSAFWRKGGEACFGTSVHLHKIYWNSQQSETMKVDLWFQWDKW